MGKNNESVYEEQCRQIFGPPDGQRICREILQKWVKQPVTRRSVSARDSEIIQNF
jgi:hypothetical protein